MSASRVNGRLRFHPMCLVVAALAFALAGCDAADPHVPAVVRAPASALFASPSSPSSTPATAIWRGGLAPPVMHTVD